MHHHCPARVLLVLNALRVVGCVQLGAIACGTARRMVSALILVRVSFTLLIDTSPLCIVPNALGCTERIAHDRRRFWFALRRLPGRPAAARNSLHLQGAQGQVQGGGQLPRVLPHPGAKGRVPLPSPQGARHPAGLPLVARPRGPGIHMARVSSRLAWLLATFHHTCYHYAKGMRRTLVECGAGCFGPHYFSAVAKAARLPLVLPLVRFSEFCCAADFISPLVACRKQVSRPLVACLPRPGAAIITWHYADVRLFIISAT